MKLLKRIPNWSTVALADPQSGGTHEDNDELGPRIAMDLPQGRAFYALLIHTFTVTLPGTGTYAIDAYGAPDATTTLNSAWTMAIAADFSPGGNQDHTDNFNPRAAGTICMHRVAFFFSDDCSPHPILTPYIAFMLGSDAVAGSWTTDVLLYGD